MTNVDFLIFGVLLLFGMLYAMLLEAAERGIHLVSAQTWMTVVVGVGATLALLWELCRGRWTATHVAQERVLAAVKR